MFNRKTFVVAATAVAIGLGSFAATQPASAATALGVASNLPSTVDSPVTEVKHGKRHAHRRHHRRHRRHGHGHFYVGPVFAPSCIVQRVKRWSPRYGHYVWVKERVCFPVYY